MKYRVFRNDLHSVFTRPFSYIAGSHYSGNTNKIKTLETLLAKHSAFGPTYTPSAPNRTEFRNHIRFDRVAIKSSKKSHAHTHTQTHVHNTVKTVKLESRTKQRAIKLRECTRVAFARARSPSSIEYLQ